MIISYFICGYIMRKIFVTELCSVYTGMKINEQCKEMMHSLNHGVVIFSNDDSFSLVYYNKVFEILLTRICNIGFPIYEALEHLEVKKVNDRYKTISVEKLINFIKSCQDAIEDENYFLANIDTLVEIRVKEILFDGREAKLISFMDCTSAQKLEKAETESKYKTKLISTISHELRTPVTAILGSLDAITEVVPEESQQYLNISRDSCNLIISHVNDLTVLIN